MPIDPGTAATIGSILDFVGGGVAGGEAAKRAKRDRLGQEYLGSRQLGAQETVPAMDAFRRLEMLPTRDRVLYQLNARLGQSPAAFNPSTIFAGGQGTFGGGAPSLGGIDFAKLQGQTGAYTPGAGGTRADLYAAILNRLGFPQEGGQFVNRPQTIPDYQLEERKAQIRTGQEREPIEAAERERQLAGHRSIMDMIRNRG